MAETKDGPCRDCGSQIIWAKVFVAVPCDGIPLGPMDGVSEGKATRNQVLMMSNGRGQLLQAGNVIPSGEFARFDVHLACKRLAEEPHAV